MRFSSVKGHDRACRILQRSAATGKMSHAYLFEGPEGCGKFKTALAFAAAAFCTSPKDGEACGSCIPCKKTGSENHPDLHILEPDGQSIKIEQMRELQKELSLRPYEASRKICIIKSSDRMGRNAANSFLKTLEEPPGNALIILIADRGEAILPTIRSRCQGIRFSPLAEEVIVEILTSRGIDYDKASLAAPLAEGSVSKALELSEEDTLQERVTILGHLKALPGIGIPSLFDISEQLSANREETLKNLDLMLSLVRDMLYSDAGFSRNAPEALRSELSFMAESQPLESFIDIIEHILDTRRSVQRNANAKLALDCLLLRLSRLMVKTA